MFDRTWTVQLPGGAGPAVFTIDNVNLPGGEPHLEMEAWAGSLATDAYIFEGDVALADAQNRITNAGKIDCLMTVPHGGTGRIRIPPDIEQRLTVFFDAADAAAQSVTIRVREC